MSDTKLLPCPFCGGKPHLTPHDSYQRGYSGMYVSCTRKSCKVSTKVRPTRLKAAEDWNRRTPDPRIAAADAMAKALEAAETFITEELACRRQSFEPDPQEHEKSYLGDATEALNVVRTALAAWEKLNPPPTPEAAQ